MSVPMRKRHTKDEVLHIVHKGNVYNIPKEVANEYKVDASVKVSSDSVLADDLFADLDQKYTKAGVLLQGLRNREGLSQVEFAKKINVTQSDLSKMEHGKRPIGKTIAKRIAEAFNVNYRHFLE
ncbi:MAG: helix-turn-helix domain-containing protein [Gammaproteobacteria bacterium]|nr:helix-turn-helix domain-containing protein [Gammaproteobacteria bacterium]MCH9743772.1 helix-turn-helix domain-containing protein [Gammaproteobacteria bacterium]